MSKQITSLSRHVDMADGAPLVERDAHGVAADASCDSEAIRVFLDSYKRHSKHTQRAYKKEIAKFMLWIAVFNPGLVRNRCAIPFVGIDDANAYIDFLVSPSPVDEKILERFGFKKQPFSNLTVSSRSLALSVLNRMYDALMHYTTPAGRPYCARNPFHGIHVGQARQDDYIEKALTAEEWEMVLDAIEQLPKATDRELAHYHRARWVFQLLYRTFLRREEACRLLMSDFFHDGSGWLIRVLGKGSKKAVIVATNRLMEEMAIYRRSLGLPETPLSSDKFPAVLPITGWKAGVEPPPEKPLTNQVIYNLCVDVFRHAADVVRLRASKTPALEAAASRLSRATPHWMRHTGVSHAMENNVSPRYVQAQARHSSLKVTARYDHKRKKAWRNELDSME